jgi:hypothetical protein
MTPVAPTSATSQRAAVLDPLAGIAVLWGHDRVASGEKPKSLIPSFLCWNEHHTTHDIHGDDVTFNVQLFFKSRPWEVVLLVFCTF